MKIRVEDIGRGTLKDEKGNIYVGIGCNDLVRDESNDVYRISAYDEDDNVVEIEPLD